MKLSFELSMPSNNSWNGKWSGANRKYVRVIDFGTSKKTAERMRKLIGYHTYSFGDGWRAGITVKEVDNVEAKALKKQSAGFCGYDWMIDSLRYYGKILDADGRKQKATA